MPVPIVLDVIWLISYISLKNCFAISFEHALGVLAVPFKHSATEEKASLLPTAVWVRGQDLLVLGVPNRGLGTGPSCS